MICFFGFLVFSCLSFRCCVAKKKKKKNRFTLKVWALLLRSGPLGSGRVLTERFDGVLLRLLVLAAGLPAGHEGGDGEGVGPGGELRLRGRSELHVGETPHSTN